MQFFLLLTIWITICIISNAFHVPKFHRIALSRSSLIPLHSDSSTTESVESVPTTTTSSSSTPTSGGSRLLVKKGGAKWDMAKCVYFGNLPLDANEEKVKNFVYTHIGPERLESVKLIVDKDTGKSKGYAYLNFKDAEDAKISIDSLATLTFEGNPVKVTPRQVRSEAEIVQALASKQRIYIANLDWSTDESGLKKLIDDTLQQPDSVKFLKIGRDDFGRSKGFAHVELNNYDHIDTLISKLNGYEGGFKPLLVERAGTSVTRKSTSGNNEKRERRPPREGSADQQPQSTPKFERAPRSQTSTSTTPRNISIFLGNLSWSVSKELLDEMLTDVLGPGSYLSVRLAQDSNTGNHRGFAHIDFKDQESAERAISELNGMELLNRVLRADRAESRSDFNNRKRETSPPVEQQA